MAIGAKCTELPGGGPEEFNCGRGSPQSYFSLKTCVEIYGYWARCTELPGGGPEEFNCGRGLAVVSGLAPRRAAKQPLSQAMCPI